MPEIEVAFIDPKAALGKLAIQAKAAKAADEDLGPSGPHQFDEPQKAKLQVKVAAQPVAMSPGLPPLVGEAHYTEVLDEIWPEFDDPEERTAARLSSLLEEVADEAQRVHLLAQDVWEKLPFYKVQDSERKRYDAEFLAYLRRLNVYRKALDELDDDSTATADVYVGLVQRKHQAGPVPDCIMHMYFAQQLGILQDHADDMGEGFVGRVMDGLGAVSEVVDEASDRIDEAKDEAAKQAGEVAETVWKKITRPILIVGGIVVGSAVAVLGTVAVVKLTERDK